MAAVVTAPTVPSWQAALPRLCRTWHRLHSARIGIATYLGSIAACDGMEPAKLRVWSEDEIKLLIELAHLKKSATAIAKQLGRHTASVRRRAHELGLLLPTSGREPG